MVRTDPETSDPSELDRIAAAPDAVREGWERTIEDTHAMMADREDDGFETLLLPAGDTTPKNPETGDTDEWGLSHLIPGNKVEPFEAFDARADYDETAVYQTELDGNVFIVTECIDLDNKLSLFIAAGYRINEATAMVRTAMERGEMRTHIKKLDGTKLRTIVHDDPGAFFPDPDHFYAYDTDEFYGLG